MCRLGVTSLEKFTELLSVKAFKVIAKRIFFKFAFYILWLWKVRHSGETIGKNIIGQNSFASEQILSRTRTLAFLFQKHIRQ